MHSPENFRSSDWTWRPILTMIILSSAAPKKTADLGWASRTKNSTMGRSTRTLLIILGLIAGWVTLSIITFDDAPTLLTRLN